MLALDDPRWREYRGGYRVPYDASTPLKQLLNSDPKEPLWDELWDELHHQGDVDQASYAAVPWLVEFIRRSTELDWNALSLIATIELARDDEQNPAITEDLAAGYDVAIQSLPSILGDHPDREWDEYTVQAAAACIALARGQRWFARAYHELSREDIARWFSEEFGEEI